MKVGDMTGLWVLVGVNYGGENLKYGKLRFGYRVSETGMGFPRFAVDAVDLPS